MSKRKYPKVKGYWVYSIKVPSVNKYYIGVSKRQCCQRWIKSLYKGKSLEPYLEEWDSMIKTVLVDNLTKEQAYQYEDNIIRGLQMNDLCINKQRSGLIEVSDINAYQRQYRDNNREEVNRKQREYRTKNREKVNKYNRERYKTNEEFRKKECKRQRQRRLKKKLEQQQNQTSLPL